MTEFYYESAGKGKIHACRWDPEGQITGVVQIVHGISEYAARYDAFARYLNKLGYLVVAEDHMGHGLSGGEECIPGRFYGGWFSAVADSVHLMELIQKEYPNLPYILFGHSMGSFMARTILISYPDCPLSGAVICGTGWLPSVVLRAGYAMAKTVCRKAGEDHPNVKLHKLMFGAYNKKVEHPRTEFDWLSRDNQQVDRYISDPLCGNPETASLARDMLEGILFIQKDSGLSAMNKELPVLFVAGGDDPVGDYGTGVRKAVNKFQSAGMKNISSRIYPLCRHEILNEINYEEIYGDIAHWMESTCGK